MKKLTFISAITFSLVMLFSTNASAQKFSDLDISPMDAATFPNNYKVADKLIKVIYSRPQLKGRDLAKLTPNGEVWRTGANEATEITFYKEVMLDNTKIEPGTYSLFTIPGENEWTILLSKDINVWGAYTYNDANTFAKITVPVTQSKEILEPFSITFEASKTGADMFLGWSTLRVKVPFTF